nr:ABC transporter transmembrane domain-containing protein [Pseudomonas sp. MWU349]
MRRMNMRGICGTAFTASRGPQSLDPNPSRDLRQAVRDYARNAGVDLHLERLALTRLTPKMLPLAWRNQSGEFMLLARLSDTQALVQRPSMPTPDMLDRLQLAEQWSGEVIRLCKRGLRFDLSWFVPELLRHRRILGEVLLCSLLLQALALATPLFFQAVMDKVMVHRALSTLDVLVMTLVVVGLFEVLFKGLHEYLAAHTANRIDIGLGVKLLRQPGGGTAHTASLGVEGGTYGRGRVCRQTLGSAISQNVMLLQKVKAVAVTCWGANRVIDSGFGCPLTLELDEHLEAFHLGH